MLRDVRRKFGPRSFVLFLVVFAAGLGAGIPTLGLVHGVMASFDAACLVFLTAIARTVHNDKPDQMREASARNDANRTLLLTFVFLNTLVVLVTVGATVKESRDVLAIVLVIATLILAFLFSNVIYALHYAHLYYRKDDDGDAAGLKFPECDEPDYWDFLYFTVTIGMAFATSDTKITSRRIRRIAIGQALAAFVFNLGVIAFAVGALGGG